MNRSSFLVSSSTLAAIAAANADAQTIPGGTHFVERAGDFNRQLFANAVNHGSVRMVWEQVAFHPQVFANVKNALNGLQFGFGYGPAQIKMAIANHGASSAYAYSDVLWTKYKLGDALKLKDASDNPVTSNIFLAPAGAPDKSADPDAPDSFWQDTSVQTLQSRGVVFLTCHTAVEEQARAFVKGGFAPAGMSATEVANDILTHLIPGAVVVPSMVAAIAVLQQEYRYAFINPDFA